VRRDDRERVLAHYHDFVAFEAESARVQRVVGSFSCEQSIMAVLTPPKARGKTLCAYRACKGLSLCDRTWSKEIVRARGTEL